MASSPKPTVAEVTAYTEDELEQFLARSGNTVKLQDPENIPFDLIERLKTTHKRLQEASKHRAVDLDQVAARLQAVSSQAGGTNDTPSPVTMDRELSPATTEDEDWDEIGLRNDFQAHHDLIRQGGRPPFPLHLIEDIFWNPERYLEDEQYRDPMFYGRRTMISLRKSAFCGVFQKNWKDFLTLQRNIRILDFPNENLLYNVGLWHDLEHFQKLYGSMTGPWSFARYQKTLRDRLVRYGFTRQFELHEDVNQQDKLTTWIEYLGCQYREYDIATKKVKRLQPRLEKARKKLVESGHIREDETYSDLCVSNTLRHHAWVVELAEIGVKSAQQRLESTENAVAESTDTQDQLQERLAANREALLTAQKQQQAANEEGGAACSAFYNRVCNYCENRATTERIGALLRWIERQIPEIEAELGVIPSATSGNDHSPPQRGAKRARGETSEDLQLSLAAPHSKSRRTNTDHPQAAKKCSQDGAGLRSQSNASHAVQSPMQSLAAEPSSNSAPDDVSTNVPPPAPRRSSRKTRSAKTATSERNSQTTQPLRRSARIAQRYKESSLKAPANATQTKQRPKRQAAQRQKDASQNRGKKGAPKKGKRRGR